MSLQRQWRKVCDAIDATPWLSPAAGKLLRHVVRAGVDGRPLPSQADLAALLGMSERTLRRALEELRRAGLLVVERNGSAPAHYVLGEAMLLKLAKGQVPPPAAPAPEEEDDLSGQDGRTSAANLAGQTAVRPANLAGQTAWALRNNSSTPPTPPAADLAAQADLDARTARFWDELKATPIKLSRGLRPIVAAVAADDRVSFGLWQSLCLEAVRSGALSWNWMERRLAEVLAAERDATGVVELDEVRKRRQGGKG